jgi:hypothetical protein
VHALGRRMQRIEPNVLRYGLVADPSVSDGEAAAREDERRDAATAADASAGAAHTPVNSTQAAE